MLMNPEIKAKWVAALRSGEYKQAKGQLRIGNSFCCLGVLCNLHAQAHWRAHTRPSRIVAAPPPGYIIPKIKDRLEQLLG